MSSTESTSEPAAAAPAPAKVMGLRKNGKQWIAPKKAFRPGSGLTSYEKRNRARQEQAATKAKEKEMKDEKEAVRQKRIENIKERRKAKEEKERYEKLEAKMHRKRVERLKRREKRNKLINS